MKFVTGLLIAAGLLGAAAPARAADVAVTFDNAVLDTPATPDSVVVEPTGEPIKAVATIDETTGAFTIAPSTFDFPKYSFSSPVAGTIDVILNAPATGTVNLTTGEVTMNADFQAQVSVTGLGDCNINTGPLVMSTENKEPLPGRRYPSSGFTVGSSPVALAVSWDSLPPGTGPGCTLINPFVGGPGGFWISKGISPKDATPPDYSVAKLALALKGKKKSAKSGGKAKFVSTVTNQSSETVTGAKYCVKAPKVKRSCLTLKPIAAGAKRKVTYTVPAPAVKKKKTFKVRFSVSAKGLKGAKATGLLVVKP